MDAERPRALRRHGPPRRGSRRAGVERSIRGERHPPSERLTVLAGATEGRRAGTARSVSVRRPAHRYRSAALPLSTAAMGTATALALILAAGLQPEVRSPWEARLKGWKAERLKGTGDSACFRSAFQPCSLSAFPPSSLAFLIARPARPAPAS